MANDRDEAPDEPLFKMAPRTVGLGVGLQWQSRPMTAEEQQKAADEINAKAKGKDDPCHVCGSTDQGVIPNLIPLESASMSNGLSKTMMPAVATICQNCGNIRLFSAITLGLLGPKPEQSNG